MIIAQTKVLNVLCDLQPEVLGVVLGFLLNFCTNCIKMASKALRALIMGAPGSGKGTIAKRIITDFDMKFLSAGDILRSHVAQGTGTPSAGFGTLPRFLPARRYASAGLCDSDVSVRTSVRTSVRHTPVLCLAERKQDREM